MQRSAKSVAVSMASKISSAVSAGWHALLPPLGWAAIVVSELSASSNEIATGRHMIEAPLGLTVT